ncbi:nucleomorphin-like [Pyrus ussuriensis x Pyrus communis]|uniref:Nucleomorphin-like n=1 Tax=Pyrus ussuriensis x Pyrus communis TaxID=2448454 RepID=A0A5N5I617_9ROSA|nr:nucleomorphin-like [Pyrus ussuriensis x Pyrus communis]
MNQLQQLLFNQMLQNADIFFGLECLDDSISQTARIEIAVNKSGDKAATSTQPGDKFFPSYSVNHDLEITSFSMVDGAFSKFEVLDIVCDVAISSVEPTMGPQTAHLVHFETGDLNESSLLAFSSGNVDHPSPRLGDSSTLNPTSDSQVNTENLAETNHLGGVILGEVVHLEAVIGTPGKLPRKRVPHKQVDELADEANDDSFTTEPYIDSKVNEDVNNDDEYREHNTSQRKIVPRKAKKTVSEKEPVQKHKRTKEAFD